MGYGDYYTMSHDDLSHYERMMKKANDERRRAESVDDSLRKYNYETSNRVSLKNKRRAKIFSTSLTGCVIVGKKPKRKEEDWMRLRWKPYPVENLPSQGAFYPEGTAVSIKPATVLLNKDSLTIK